MAMIIGLTGSIASGKSTVSQMLTDFGMPIVDADVVSRQVVEPGKPAYKKIVAFFGEQILLQDDTINRKKLGEIVFSDEEKREKLNSFVHPHVREEMRLQQEAFIAGGAKAVILDIPLLFESKLTGFVDKVIVVYVDERIQLERLMKRDNFTTEEAIRRMKSQIPVAEKALLADAVINNSGTIESTRAKLIELLKNWDLLNSHL